MKQDEKSADEMFSRTAYSAPLIFPGNCTPPLENATLIIEDGQIVEVTTRSVPDAKQFSNCAIIPALINAHTHLEFSDFRQPFPAGENFPAWIRSVVSSRSQRSDSVQDTIRQGVAECESTGAAALGEICTHLNSESTNSDAECYSTSNLNITCFRELIGFNSQSISERLKDAKTFIEKFESQLSIGLSPHAPYSVHPQLFSSLIEFAVEKELPVAFHLAETKEELQLLKHQTGPFREMLEQFGIWDKDALDSGTRPLDYLKQMDSLKRGLIIHGNYLEEDELEFLSSNPNLFLVYCARTHAHFEHSRYPLEKIIDSGVSLALGTDSRASNPDLSLWKEMQFIAQQYPKLSREKLLELGTLQGAKALRIDSSLGTLEPGKAARFCLIEMQSESRKTAPFEALFTPNTHPVRFD